MARALDMCPLCPCRNPSLTDSGHCVVLVLLDLTDSGHCVVLVLDLTAAFDTVDHEILVARLEQWVGISGTPLEWFRSYLL